MKVSYMRWVVNHPWVVMVVSLLLAVLAAQNLGHLTLNNDPRTLLSEENPDFKRFTHIDNTFISSENVVFAVRPKSGDIFTNEALKAIEELTDKGWEMTGSIRVDSLANYQHTTSEGDDLLVDYLVKDAGQFSDQKLQKIKKITLSQPSLVNSLVSKTGQMAGVVIAINLDEKRRDAPQIASEARAVRDEFRANYPDMDFYVSGTVVFSDAMAKASEESLAEIIPYALVVVTVCFGVILRSFFGTLATVLVVALSCTGAMGLAVLAKIEFQPVTMFGPAIILTLAVADCLHILVTFKHGLRQGLEKKEAMVESLRINYQPVMLTSVTTAIGFLGLNASESPPFRDLGNIVACGVMIAFALALTLLPAVMMVAPVRQLKQKEEKPQMWMEAFARFVIRNKKQLLVVMTLFVVGLVAAVPLNQFNDVWSEYFDESYEVRIANDIMIRELSGLHRFEVAIPSGKENGIYDIEYLSNLEKFAAWLKTNDKIVSAVPFSEVHKRLNKTMHGDMDKYYILPDSRELAAQYFLLYEMSLPMGLDIQNQVSFDRSQTRYVITMQESTSEEVLATAEEMDQWIANHFPANMQTKVTGLDVVFSGMGKRNAYSMISGTFLALLLISACIMYAMKSVKYGFMSLLPNLLPALTAFGVWGLINGYINLASSVVACLTIGIVVDDTVHFLSKYVRARKEQNLSSEQAVLYAFKTVGVALVSTSIILVGCFGVQAFSHFGPAAALGLLSSITIFLALVVDFFFFVPFLLVFDKDKDAQDRPQLDEGQEGGGDQLAA